MQWLIKALCQGGHPTSIPKFVGVTRKGTVEVLLFYLCNLYCNLYFFFSKTETLSQNKTKQAFTFPVFAFPEKSLLKNLNEIHL